MALTEEQRNQAISMISGNTKKPEQSETEYLLSLKQEVEQPTSFIGRVQEDISERQENVADILDPTDTSRSDLGKLTGASAEVAGAISNTAYEALPEVARSVLDKIGGGIGKGFKVLTDKIGESKFLQEAVKGDTSKLENALQIASDLGLIAGEVAGLAETGAIANAGIRATTKGLASQASKLTPTKISTPDTGLLKGLRDIGEDITPKAVDIADRQIAKSLQLAPVEDIARFKELTKNDLGEFFARNDLIKDTTQETVEALGDFQRKNFDTKKNAVALVDEKFTFEDLPELEDIIDNLSADLAKGKSNEFKNQLRILQDIKSKNEFDLSQVEYVKALSDDLDSFYTRTGEVRSGPNIADQENLVRNTRRFIEDRVEEVFPEANIKQLNNNTQSSRFLLDTIAKRAGKGDTKSLASLGDYAVLGIGNNAIPGGGIAALIGKKLIESSPVRLRIARNLYNRAIKKGDIDVAQSLNADQLKEIQDLLGRELDEVLNIKTPE